METLQHPTHHRRFQIVCGLCAVAGLLAFGVASALFEDARTAKFVAIGAFFVMVIGAIVWSRVYARHCRCPRCGRRLNRDATAAPENHYPCEPCKVVWVSQIVNIG
jgi:hypothetical protein